MILRHLFADEARVPLFGPAPKTLILTLRVEQPQLADPKISRPIKALLLFPLARLIIAFGEEAQALVAVGGFGRRLCDHALPLRGRAFRSLAHERDSFGVGLTARWMQSIRRRGFRRGDLR